MCGNEKNTYFRESDDEVIFVILKNFPKPKCNSKYLYRVL